MNILLNFSLRETFYLITVLDFQNLKCLQLRHKIYNNYKKMNNASQTFQTIFFNLGFLSRTFTIHRVTQKREGYLFNFSLLLPTLDRYFNISRAINAESSSLHIASSWTQIGNL